MAHIPGYGLFVAVPSKSKVCGILTPFSPALPPPWDVYEVWDSALCAALVCRYAPFSQQFKQPALLTVL